MPEAIFFQSAQDICEEHGIEDVIRALRNAQQKFKFTESQFARFYESMEYKIPEIEKAIELVNELIKKKDIQFKTKYILTEGIFTEAEAKGSGTVFLWLGANTMVEYEYEEALELLEKNLTNAKKNYDTYATDLEFIKE